MKKAYFDGGFIVHLKNGLKIKHPGNPSNIKITNYTDQLFIRVFEGRVRISSNSLVIFSKDNKEEYRISVKNVLSVIDARKSQVVWLAGAIARRAA